MPRGVWEKIPGSGIWWVHYVDAEGKRRREKVGRKADAIKLYQQPASPPVAKQPPSAAGTPPSAAQQPASPPAGSSQPATPQDGSQSTPQAGSNPSH